MKNTKRLLFIVIIISFSLTNCKKGEDDPFFSFRSRKARITGEWVLKSGNIVQKDANSEIVQTFDGNYKYISSDTIPFQEKWTISKNGDFEKIVITSVTSTTTGTWSFGNKDKAKDLKNKESLVVRITRYQTNQWSGPIDISYSGTTGPIETYIMKELRNKTLTIKYEGTSTENNLTVTYSGTMTYEKQ